MLYVVMGQIAEGNKTYQLFQVMPFLLEHQILWHEPISQLSGLSLTQGSWHICHLINFELGITEFTLDFKYNFWV